jgi:uncharacterized membrane protein
MSHALKSSYLKPEKNRLKSLWQPGWQLALFVAAHLIIFIVIFHTIYKTPYSAVVVYFNYASQVLDGNLPYRDFSMEYPPFALVFFLIPRLFASTWQGFSGAFQTEVLIFDLISLFIIYLIARRLGKAPWKLLTVYTLAFLAMGPIIGQQFDIFPAVLTLLSLYFFWRGHHKISWALLALGTMTKLYPVVIAPVYVFYYLRNRQYHNLATTLATFILICLIILAPLLIISPESIQNLIVYHGQRGLQIESTYSALVMILSKLGLTNAATIFNYGSWNLSGSLADFLARASTVILGLLLLLAYWFIYSQIKPGKSQFTRLGAYAILLISITLFASKILSPQYIIWLVPLVPLVFNRFRYSICAVFIAIGAATYIIFPYNYLEMIKYNDHVGLIVVLFLRDILLIVLAILAGMSLKRMKSSD